MAWRWILPLQRRERFACPWLVPLALALSVVVASPLVHAPATSSTDWGRHATVSDVESSGLRKVPAGGPVPAAAIPAPAAPEWINVTRSVEGATPPGAWGGGMAFDTASNETVYFGGCTVSQCPDNQTWVFSQGTWANITNPSDAPPARVDTAMDYDPNMGGVLMFGGQGQSGQPLGDTWLFAGGVWENLSWVGQGPAPRGDASLAFDPDPEVNGSVLFGGCSAFQFCFNDTWVWQGWAGWVPMYPSSPPPAAGWSAMAFDPVSDYLVLFGGVSCASDACSQPANTTWEFFGNQWWNVTPLGASPPARIEESLVWDFPNASLLLFGGAGDSGDLGDTWNFSNENWTELSDEPAPSPRWSSAMAANPAGFAPVLFGGNSIDDPYLDDTWVYEAPPSVTVSARASTTQVSAPVNYTLSIVGGTPSYRVTIDYGDGATATATSSRSSLTFVHAYLRPGTFDATVSVTDAMGALATSTPFSVQVAAAPYLDAAALPTASDVGLPVKFVSSEPSGPSSVDYSWSFGDGTQATGQNVSHTYTSPGIYRVQANGTDPAGGTSSATFYLPIAPRPMATVVTPSTSVAADSPTEFFANVSGGTAPFSYSWIFGDGTTSSFAGPTHSFGAAGSFTVQVWVNDSVGGSTHAEMNVTVVGASLVTPPTTPSSSTAIPQWFWVALAVLIVVGVIGTLLLVVRRKS